MTDAGMMDYSPAEPPKQVSVEVQPVQSGAEGRCAGCPALVPLFTLHRLEYSDGTRASLCGTCCPNCYGGEGHGPT